MEYLEQQPIGFPEKQGLYDPANEQDSCGVGFIAQLKGKASHDIVIDALEMLHRMDHRGACGCEPNTGDGAGILTAIPHALFNREYKQAAGKDLPAPGHYAVGMFFLPQDEENRAACKKIVEKYIAEHNQTLLGWRAVPISADNADIGPSARKTEPFVEQVFIGASTGEFGADCDHDQNAFERELYTIRKQAFHDIKKAGVDDGMFYVPSLSSKIITYKGQLTSYQVPQYYADLRDPDYTSHLAMVHSRFSTNTFPSWDRAQPLRWMSHNGEINTLRGNSNWTKARQGLMKSELFGENLDLLMPVIDPTTSDSGTFDNVLELLILSGRSLPEAVMMMIPEAWENHESMSPSKRAFYEFHANLMEAWDGPASVVFTDGTYIGATLDRNGLRPSRYYVTKDDRVVMASEVGVVPDIPTDQVVAKGRLQPGKMFLVNFNEGRIIADEELKSQIATTRPYGQWLQDQRIELSSIPGTDRDLDVNRVGQDEILEKLQAFGYTTEHLNMLLRPMCLDGKDPIGSMGNDTALAVLSDKPRLSYEYFKQLFAQVTNPPIDSIREEIIMSLQTFVGPEGNVLDTTEKQAHRIHLPQPILSNAELDALKDVDHRGFKAKTIDITFHVASSDEENTANMVAAIDRICEEARQAIADGYQLIVLSDRATSHDRVPISSLIAGGAVHHHLVNHQQRTQVGIVLESGEAREVHHFCLLIGYGVDAINPYMAFEAIFKMRDEGFIDPDALTAEKAVANYIKAVGTGILKVMSKMGISTVASYKGAQIFEAIGLHDEVITRCFNGTASRLQGAGFDIIAAESKRRHALGFPRQKTVKLPTLPNPGDYHWRAGGEKHLFNPQSIANLQAAGRTNSRKAYEDYAVMMNDDAKTRSTLRGLFKFKFDQCNEIPIDEVQPAQEIVKRFRTGAMSMGSLSKEAHETLAVAMNRIGARSNSGEGGEDIARFKPSPDGDLRRSAIKQIASGRFGVTSHYLSNADVLQIKIAQGAKPGEGGQLPGFKVDQAIASLRYSTPGVGLISPPPHHDIYSIEDLAQLIYDLKNSNPYADVSVKLVSEVGVGTIAAGVSKAHADHILISGHDGGTGASPLTSIKHAGLPWELGLAETHQTLVLNDLRSRVRLETDGGLKTGRDVIIAAMLGAEEYGFSTAPLITLGCIMMRKCHLNTCPVGICTQDKTLRKKFKGTPENVINFLFLVAEEAREVMAKLGIRTIDELIGQVQLLDTRDAVDHWKADGLDLTPILTPANKPHDNVGIRKLVQQDHALEEVLDRELIKQAMPALKKAQSVTFDLPIENINRTAGAMLSNQVSRKYEAAGLPADTITVNFNGSAGQSFGAFLAPGITFNLEGDANDYVGKGLSGGRVAIFPPKNATFQAEDNIIAGNVCLYGATSGEAYFRGVAAERFCVRNSGAKTVIEGVGDHGCEYMTGGRTVILGPTGRNFAAGMSGGIAYIYDPENNFLHNCNLGMVELEKLDQPEDQSEVRTLIENHLKYTGSPVAEKILNDWDNATANFVKVMPIDYKRVLKEQKLAAVATAAHDDMPSYG
ncbi:Ferredoxin-dependent glutamate synthase 1 [Poriferisphaera corsica]|uniref:Glutamate synthase [NADPH] large chain n=2 Tax=Poriferisphaera corsica TaxID=2528020 RepID=A0A517YP48_9BACT|nr:Ferredoxin-dependent glutamate synthase 1 [Poriferisphaera corsica]